MGRETSRWTYTSGSRPEGVVVYDDDTKIHSHHDTDPARGQHSAFDLVRLHRFGHLDTGAGEVPVTDRPSYQAMVGWASELPEIRAERAGTEFVDLGPQDPSAGVTDDKPDRQPRFVFHSADDFSSGAPLEWIVRDVLPRAELAVVFGESGSGKTFLVTSICSAITRGIEWCTKRAAKGRVAYVCAEGGRGFKKRLKADAHEHGVELGESFAILSDTPNLLESKDAAEIVKAIKDYFGPKAPAKDSGGPAA